MAQKYKIGHFSYSLVGENENKYFLSLNEKRFYVGRLVIEILELLQLQKSYEEIALELNKNHSTILFDEDVIKQTVEGDFVRQGILQDETNPVKKEDTGLRKYIYGRVNFLKSQNHPRILHALGFLFTPAVFIVVSIISIVLTSVFLSKTTEIIANIGGYGSYMMIFLFAFSILNTLWHELGHASATYRYGVMPKDIGFGFYIIYPVFFTDVSDIWKLNRKQRNMVNIGGIYFQMIANIILVCLYYISPVFWIAPTLIAFNTGIAFLSLNPFFRYDGYWIYSDCFDLPNLRSESHLVFKEVVYKLIGRETQTWKELFSKPIPLLFYAFASNIFFAFIWITLLWGCIIQVQAIKEIIDNANTTGWSYNVVLSIIRKLFLIGMLFIFIAWTFNGRKKK